MSKVIRITDYTEKLLKDYQEKTKKMMNKYGLDYEILIRSDDQLIQAALLKALEEK